MSKSIIFCLLIVHLFGDFPLETLSLENAEAIALEHNKNFRIAEQITDSANERKLQAVSRFFPKINYRAEMQTIDQKALFYDVFTTFNQSDFGYQGYSSILQLSQPIFSTDLIFGLKSAKYELDLYSSKQAQTQNELLRAIRDRYYRVVQFEKALVIERENIDYLAFALEQEQGKLKAGNSTPFEVNQSKVSVANAISLYYSTLKVLKSARNALILTMGIDPLLEPEMCLSEKEMPIESIPELSYKLDLLNEMYHYRDDYIPSTADFLDHITRLESARKLTLFTPDEVQEYLDLAFYLRPDLQVQKMGIDVADQNVNTKVGTYFPKVSGYVRYSYNDNELGTRHFFDESYNWSAGFVLSWNVFDSMLREHEVREARAQREATKISYAREWQRVEVEVRNGLYQLEETMLTYLSSNQAVMVAEQARKQAQDKLEFGRIAPLDYRDAINQLLQAQNQRNQASFDLLEAYYEVRYATGIDAGGT